MERRQFGRAGEVAVVGAGTWRLDEAERAAAVESLRAALDAGATHVDTAEMYGDGEAERVVAEALAGRRDEVFLVSKVLPHNASRSGTRRACEASLERLQTDRLDCYLLHWPGDHPLDETFAAFEELERAGKIRSWGVSNFDLDLLEDAVRIAGPGRIACNQVCYHLEARYAEARLWARCRQLGVALVGYSPFGSGSFPAASSAGGRVLSRVARELSATPRQVALAFLTRLPDTFVIPKTADPKRAEENATRVTLTAEQVRAIDEAFPFDGARQLPVI